MIEAIFPDDGLLFQKLGRRKNVESVCYQMFIRKCEENLIALQVRYC